MGCLGAQGEEQENKRERETENKYMNNEDHRRGKVRCERQDETALTGDNKPCIRTHQDTIQHTSAGMLDITKVLLW